VRYCDEMLIDSFGISPEELTYVENPWSGGGNAGPALEVIIGGLELATLVFMNLEEDDDGDVEIKGLRYKEMDCRSSTPATASRGSAGPLPAPLRSTKPSTLNQWSG